MKSRPIVTLTALLILTAAAPAEAAFLFVPRRPMPQARVALESETVDVSIEDGVATVRIEDVFRNHGSRPGEGDVVMPLPKGTVLMGFSIRINGQEVKGEVLDKDAAAKVYTDIVRTMRDPLLAEWAGRDLVRVRLFPVPPRGEQTVRVEYATVLPVDHDLQRFTYPMKGTGAATSGGARGVSFEMSVDLRAAKDVRNIYSPTHEIDVDRRGPREARVRVKDRHIDPTRDLVLYYSVSGEDLGFGVIPHRKGGQDGYFLMTFQPRVTRSKRPPSQLVLVLDVSGSMSGLKLQSAKEALRFGINRMRPEDRFNVVAFSSDTDALFERPVTGSAEHREQALAFVNDLEAEGGTDIDGAMGLALSGLDASGFNVVFITDGEPTVGETKTDRILKNVRGKNDEKARVFVFGVGDDLNAQLLDALSRENSGSTIYVRPGEEIEVSVSNFFGRITSPALLDLRLSVKGVEVDKVIPRELPVLFRGDQLVVVGRYRGEGRATIVLKGIRDGREEVQELVADFPRRDRGNDFVPKLWATRRVALLLENIRANGEHRELVDEVTRLGKRFGIVTPYTSYLIKEEEQALRPPTPTPGPRPQPRPRPIRQLEERRARAGAGQASLGGGGVTKAPMAKAAAPAYERESLADASSFREVSGASAVAASRSLDVMKKTNSVSSAEDVGVVTVQTVGDRSFVFRAGAWIDQDAEGAVVTARVQYLSALYLAILDRFEELRGCLALGERVTLRLGDVVLAVGPDGQTDVDEGLLTRIGDGIR